jgi:hypothetical protein
LENAFARSDCEPVAIALMIRESTANGVTMMIQLMSVAEEDAI